MCRLCNAVIGQRVGAGIQSAIVCLRALKHGGYKRDLVCLQALKRAERLQYQCEHLKAALRKQDADEGHPAAATASA